MTLPATATDVISDLASIQNGSALAELRAQRPEAMTHAQGSYDALFEPAQFVGLSLIERLAAALRVATRHAAPSAIAHYRQRLVQAGASSDVVSLAAGKPSNGPISRLEAILNHADLLASRPVEARPEHLQALADAGLTTRAIVVLAQVIAFVSFQVRVVTALQIIGGGLPESDAAGATPGWIPRGAADTTPADGHDELPRAPSQQPHDDNDLRPAPSQQPHDDNEPRRAPSQQTDAQPAQILHPDATLRRPTAFTIEQLEWAPWLAPLDLADATPDQATALEGSRGNSPYFRLLAREVAVLVERTATDRGIFYTPGGAPRGDRELAAAATSRLNGCIYCTSVHARLAAQLSKNSDEIDRLLRLGVAPGTELGLDDRWQAVVELAVALAPTPPRLEIEHVERLRQLWLSDLEILDVAQAGAFFAWANRLMLTLGEPYYADPPTGR